MKKLYKMKKGSVYYANLNLGIGSEQSGKRPVIVLQNTQGNICSTTTIVVPLTNYENCKPEIPTHVILDNIEFLPYKSVALVEQMRVIDKKRIMSYMGQLEDEYLELIDKKIITALNIKRRM